MTGVGLVLRNAGSAGAFSLEISGRLANMENLLEGMAAQLQQMSPHRQNPEP